MTVPNAAGAGKGRSSRRRGPPSVHPARRAHSRLRSLRWRRACVRRARGTPDLMRGLIISRTARASQDTSAPTGPRAPPATQGPTKPTTARASALPAQPTPSRPPPRSRAPRGVARARCTRGRMRARRERGTARALRGTPGSTAPNAPHASGERTNPPPALRRAYPATRGHTPQPLPPPHRQHAPCARPTPTPPQPPEIDPPASASPAFSGRRGGRVRRVPQDRGVSRGWRIRAPCFRRPPWSRPRWVRARASLRSWGRMGGRAMSAPSTDTAPEGTRRMLARSFHGRLPAPT
mmetsp:Transcript_4868/g.10760  ORF Transcript_4868/g.10760 Transcript_4868/m.10760 type:complete len:293 (-) Transcript_4868:1471-2349(-)